LAASRRCSANTSSASSARIPSVHPRLADAIAAGAIIFASVTNIVGVRLGALFAGISTVAKFGALALLVLASFAMGGSVGGSFENFASNSGAIDAGLFGLSLISVMWAYDGFADLTFASGEVKDPQRNLPRAIIIGTLMIIAIYLTANAAYLYINPIGVMAKSRLIPADTMGTLFGQNRRVVCLGDRDDLDVRIADGIMLRRRVFLRDGRRQAAVRADRARPSRNGRRRYIAITPACMPRVSRW
jgi:hypothetical protein